MSPAARREVVAVTGATGTTGRHVVAGLLERGMRVRALVRRPAAAGLPGEVDVVPGALEDDAALARLVDGADAAFLLWPGHEATGVDRVAARLASAGHVVHLSAGRVQTGDPDLGGVMPGVYEDVERAVAGTAASWTFVRPGGFAANTLGWADQVRAGDTVRLPHPDAGRSLVDERDLAEVVVHALLDPSLAGQAPVVTGPETLTQREQVAAIGAAVGRPLVVEALDEATALRRYAAVMGDDFAHRALEYWGSLVDRPERVTDGVETVTGHPPRPFAAWARDRADRFAGRA